MENIYDVLKGDQPELLKKLETNEEFCTFLALAYAHLLEVVMESSEDPRDLEVKVGITMERLLRVESQFVRKEHLGAALIRHNKLYWQRNKRLVELMKVNRSVHDLALNAVQVVERWMLEKPYRKEVGFSNIRFENAMRWKGNNNITAELILKTEYDYAVREKLGWNKEPEQEAEEDRRIILP